MNWNLNSPQNTRAIMTQQLLSTSFLFLKEERTVFRCDCGSSVQLQASGWVLTDTLQPPLLEDELLISVVRRCLEHFIALYNRSLFIQDVILFYLNKHTQLWLFGWQLKPSYHVTNSLSDYHLALPLLPLVFWGEPEWTYLDKMVELEMISWYDPTENTRTWFLSVASPWSRRCLSSISLSAGP